MLDQGEPVIGQDVRRIGRGIMRFRTVPVATEVRQNDATPLLEECVGPGVERTRAPEAAQQQDQRSAGAGLPIRQFYAVATSESITVHIHGPNLRDLASSVAALQVTSAGLARTSALCITSMSGRVFVDCPPSQLPKALWIVRNCTCPFPDGGAASIV